jgi:cation/acetate symporter
MTGSRLGIVLAALALSTAIVLVARMRGTRSVLDFQLAGRQVGVLMNACAICGDYVSAASFLGVAAAVYAAGFDGAWYAAGFAAGFVPVLLFVATPLRRFGERSLPDFLGRRFRSGRVRLLAVVVVELIILVYLVPQAVASGIAWELLGGVTLPGLSTYATGIVLSTSVTATLVVIGGMRGTTWNQAVQFVLLMLILLWLALLVANRGFSYAEAIDRLDQAPLTTPITLDDGTEELVEVESRLNDGPALFGEPGARYGAVGHFALLVTLVAGTAGLPHVMNRFFTSPSGRAARMTTVWVLVFVGVFYTMAVMLGTAARDRIAAEASSQPWLAELTVDGVLRVPEHALLALGRLYAGELGLSAVTTGAMLAIVSTIGGLLLAASASWGHDVYERHINPRATRVQALRAGQLAVVVMAVVASAAALPLDPNQTSNANPSVVAALVTMAFALAGSTLTPAVILGIWWKRTSTAGAMTGMAVGLVVSVIALIWTLVDGAAPELASAPVIITGPLVSAVIVGVSLLTNPVADVDDIWVTMHGSAGDRRAERLAQATLDARFERYFSTAAAKPERMSRARWRSAASAAGGGDARTNGRGNGGDVANPDESSDEDGGTKTGRRSVWVR